MNKLNFKSVLILVVVIPLIGVFCLSLFLTSSSYTVFRNAEEFNIHVDLTRVIGDYIHETQKERGATSFYLSSNGTKFKDELVKQRKLTDERLQSLNRFLDNQLTSVSLTLGERIAYARHDLNTLEGVRNKIDNLQIELYDAIDYYSLMNRRFILVLIEIAKISEDVSMSYNVTSYLNFLQGKEKAGLERALLASVFEKDEFSKSSYVKTMSVIKEQEIYFDLFKLYAEEVNIEEFNKILNSESGKYTSLKRKLAFDNSNLGAFGVDPKEWFKQMTDKINQFHDLEINMASQLVEKSRANVNSKWIELITIALISIGLLVLSILLTKKLMNRVFLTLGGDPCELKLLLDQIEDGDLNKELSFKIDYNKSGVYGSIINIRKIFREKKKKLEANLNELNQVVEKMNTLEQEQTAELQGINLAVLRVELSPDSRILDANNNFLKLVQYDLKELQNKKHRELVFDEDIKANEYKEFWRNLKLGIFQEAEYRRKSKSGNEIWIKGAYIPVKNDKHEVLKIIKIAYDITETKKALKETEDFKYALDQSAIVAMTDQKGVITYVNDKFCELSKYSEEELLGQDHRIVNSGYHSKEFIQNLWVTIASGKIWRNEVKNRAKDGLYYWVDTTIIPFLDTKGKPYQYVSIRNDITDRKLAEEQILKVNKELDQFAYVVSHDLKAPLRAINTITEFLEEDLEGKLDEDTRYNFSLLRSRTRRMQNLITDILDYSKIGKNKVEKRSVDTRKLIDEVIKDIEIPSNFTIDIEGNLPTLNIQRVFLSQVFANLISNAIKYNDKAEGNLKIYVKNEQKKSVFYFKDNGLGIEEQYHKKVFEIFQTLEKKEGVDSTGIGLSTVRKIINEMNGDIYIESELGKGSTFIVEIPY